MVPFAAPQETGRRPQQPGNIKACKIKLKSHLLTNARKYLANLSVQRKTAWAVLAASQLTELIIWATASAAAARTKTSVAAAAVSFISAIALCLLSYVEHVRLVRPSSFLNGYLSVTLLFDIAHSRTLWLRAEDGSQSLVIAGVSIAVVAAKAVLLALEAVEKRRLLRPEYRSACPPEATGGIFNRYLFCWLNPLFYDGFSHVLELGGLYELDKHLGAAYCHQKFLAAWSAGK
jgi:hypothetical protein